MFDRAGATAEPEVAALQLTPAHELLIVATGGVWGTMSEAEAVTMVGAAATPAAGCQQVLPQPPSLPAAANAHM